MMRSLKIFISATIFLIILPVFVSAQIRVTKVGDSFNAGNTDGIIYALPRTIIQVDVTLEQKHMLAGPLRNYAEKYLGITNYIRSDEMSYSIKDVQLTPVWEADPDQLYFVGRGEKTSKATWQTIIQLNGHGMITSIKGVNAGQAGVAGALKSDMSEEEVMAIFTD